MMIKEADTILIEFNWRETNTAVLPDSDVGDTVVVVMDNGTKQPYEVDSVVNNILYLRPEIDR